MMVGKPIDDLLTTLHIALVTLGILVLVLLYRNYRVDRLRDELFSLRDELFDFAVGAGLVDKPGYRQLRNMMNGMIRFSHRISFVRLILAIILEKLMIPESNRINPAREWEKTLSDMPITDRDTLLAFHSRMADKVMRFMAGGVFTNPVHLLLLLIIFVYTGFRSVGIGSNALLKKIPGMRLIEDQALRTLGAGGHP